MSDDLLKRLRDREIAWLDKECGEAADRIEQAERRVAELQQDAARYRWLRSQPIQCKIIANGWHSPEDFDAAIDKVMKEGK